MKKYLILIIILITTATSIKAQEKMRVGGGLVYTTGYHYDKVNSDANKSPFLGIFITGIYEMKLSIQLAPSLTYFIPHVYTLESGPSTSIKSTVSAMMFDLNAHYVFNSLDRFEFYGLAGADILVTSRKETFNGKEHDNALGLNLGAGSYIKATKQMLGFVEAKYVFSKYGQFMVNAGVLVNLTYIIKHSKEPV
ncbi:MAG TPA: outer membrane beta-barrel protein [Bacteroidales bacterium]|nr:outer membrane beta-barrel protein [Bacteroidales bacterium]